MISNHLLRARRVLWVCCAALALVIELATTPHGAFARTTSQFEALPLVRSRQNHLLLRAFINGRPAWLTVDSGAPVSAIALNRREYFRLKPITAKSSLPARVQINGGFNNVAIARELRIGGLSLVDEPVVRAPDRAGARDLGSVHQQFGAGVTDRAGHPEVIGVQVRDERGANVRHADPRVGEPRPERGLRLRGVHPAIDDRPAAIALDEIDVHRAQ